MATPHVPDHRVRISFSPWDDCTFHDAFERAMSIVVTTDVDIDDRAAAQIAEALLHAEGYPTACVEYTRSVDDLMHGRARWLVWRDGPPAPH